MEPNFFNKVAIDSKSFLMEYELANVTNATPFTDSFQKIYSSGEIETEKTFYENYWPMINEANATQMKYKVVQRLWNGENTKFIQFMPTSKLLNSNYFDGINKGNILKIYEYILKDGVIAPTFESFMKCNVTDVDLKKDFKLNIESFKLTSEQLKTSALDAKQRHIYTKRVNSSDGVFGVQYNERHKATPKAPFAKWYFKSNELLTKSEVFFKKHLQHLEPIVLNGIGRFEVTVKNSKHKNELNISHLKTCEDWMNVPQTELQRIHTEIITQYYQNAQPTKAMNTDLSTPQKVSVELIELILSLNPTITREEIVFRAIRNEIEPLKKHRSKRWVEDVISKAPGYNKLTKNSSSKSDVIEVMKNLGIW